MSTADDADLERGITITAVGRLDMDRNMLTNLEEIESVPSLKWAHGLWQSREAQLKNSIDNHESQVSNLTNEIYQLLGFASAFQGLLLTAVAQASQLKCHNVGIPLALSLFATVVTLAGVWQKKGIIAKLKRTLSTEDLVRRAYRMRVQILEQQGRNSRFIGIPPKVTNKGRPVPAGICSSRWVTYNNGVVVCVLLLGGICSLFIYRVLCDA